MVEKITPEKVLDVLSDTPKTQSEIAKELGCYRGTPRRHLEKLAASGAARLTEQGWIKTGTAYVAQHPATGATQAQETVSVEDIIREGLPHCEWFSDCDPDGSLLEKVGWAIAEHGDSLCYCVDDMITCLADEDEKSRDCGATDYKMLKTSVEHADLHLKAIEYLKAYQKALEKQKSE